MDARATCPPPIYAIALAPAILQSVGSFALAGKYFFFVQHRSQSLTIDKFLFRIKKEQRSAISRVASDSGDQRSPSRVFRSSIPLEIADDLDTGEIPSSAFISHPLYIDARNANKT